MTSGLRRGADALLEGSVVGGFSRLGPMARRRLFGWPALERLEGRTIAVTGATSGLGRELALEAAALGADVVLVVRDANRGEALASSLRTDHDVKASVVVADLGDLDAVRGAADALCGLERLDALVHNAGALSVTHQRSPQGFELTYAVHVLAPFLLTARTIEKLSASSDPRVIMVTSGGMYTQPLDVGNLDAPPAGYSGSVAYARCKRAQVCLVEQFAPQLAARGVLICAFHPGWADTEGVAASLPRFRTLMRPLLRTPAEGVDTALWLLGAPRTAIGTADLYSDRASRALHRLRSTARSDTPEARARLVARCAADCGLDDDKGCS